MGGFARVWLATTIVLSSLLAGITFNSLVIGSCEFLESANGGNAQFGIWRYAINNSTSEFDTQGECTDLSELFDKEEFDWKYRTAQVCSVLALCGGVLVLAVVVLRQFCIPVPFGDKLEVVGYLSATVSTSLVWLVKTNGVCDSLLGGCEWGAAAAYLLVAEISYIVAIIVHNFLPDPKERRAERRRAKEEGRDIGGQPSPPASPEETMTPNQARAAATDGNTAQIQSELNRANAQIQALYQENEQTKKALAAATAATAATATGAAVAAGEEAAAQLKKVTKEKKALEKQLEAMEMEKEKANNKEMGGAMTSAAPQPGDDRSPTSNKEMEAKMHDLTRANKKMKRALAAAVAEAAELKNVQEENDALKLKLDEAKDASDEAASRATARIQELETDNDKTIKALEAAIAASGTAAATEAVRINKLKKENGNLKEQLQQQEATVQALNDENEKMKTALEAATAVTSAAATAEAIKIKNLEDELGALKQTNEALVKQMEQSKAETKAKLEPLDSNDEKETKALAATVTGAAEVSNSSELQEEIEKLRQENDELKSQLDQSVDGMSKLDIEIEELKGENEATTRGLIAATAGSSPAAVDENATVHDLEDQVQTLLNHEEELLKEVEQSRQTAEQASEMIQKLELDNEELRVALATSTISSSDATAQADRDGDDKAESASNGDLPAGHTEGPSSAMTLPEVLAENRTLKEELDMIKAEYEEKMRLLEEAEASIRLVLSAKIDELQDKNEKRKEALEVATAKVSHDSHKMHDLRKQKKVLQDRIHELEEENDSQPAGSSASTDQYT